MSQATTPDVHTTGHSPLKSSPIAQASAAVRTIRIYWDGARQDFVIDQPRPIRLRQNWTITLTLDLSEKGAPQDVSIDRVHIFYKPVIQGMAKKNQDLLLGSWHRSHNPNNPNPVTDLGAYSIMLNENGPGVVITDIEKLSYPVEHRYQYGVEIVAANGEVYNVDPELINESGK